ncbi:hypothetical protein NQ318_015671 [Aromia moschata]|uniref:Uncharacterized protein n=1 Tax=Aromia moschata TaxID=1265417 RepID=A0AAV8XRW3_9CUCU|nr:hypothetical protein NQ318_015671 [Aromia moschata]
MFINFVKFNKPSFIIIVKFRSKNETLSESNHKLNDQAKVLVQQLFHKNVFINKNSDQTPAVVDLQTKTSLTLQQVQMNNQSMSQYQDTNTDPESHDNPWTGVIGKKRQRSSPEVSTNKKIPEPIVDFSVTQQSVLSFDWSPAFSTIIATIRGSCIMLWDFQRKGYAPQTSVSSPTGCKNTLVEFTENGRCLVAGDIDGNIHENSLFEALYRALATKPELLRKLKKVRKSGLVDETYMVIIHRLIIIP